jgi:hypothetical protein
LRSSALISSNACFSLKNARAVNLANIAALIDQVHVRGMIDLALRQQLGPFSASVLGSASLPKE